MMEFIYWLFIGLGSIVIIAVSYIVIFVMAMFITEGACKVYDWVSNKLNW